ncbi:DsbA family protein [Blastochloris sulfoviridis]|uniref:DsbA family protein n=1 Tax=Blastochloris sulfoviridis TaxID=50712 RepID=A0A5M6I1A8_9HYPH|nr:DsbA family protein [Blastochloris sulfoviridis]KAA5601963.1 DsbA family protein [Blastochloris sulfoviridis]
MTLFSLKARTAVAGLALLAAIAVAAPAWAQSAAPLSREDVEKIVRETIVKNPEILQEAMQELEKRANADEDKRRKQALSANRDLLLNSPKSIVIGNPKGDVTIVEFFDYNCGFCKRALSDLIGLVKTDSNLKVVLKDFPVLGESSVQAATVALAAKLQANPAKYFEFHQKLMGGRGEANRERAMAVAKEVGFDMARLTKDMESPAVMATLQENFRLAQDLGLTGTPSYVVGSEVVVGAVGLEKLQEQIRAARAACPEKDC